MCASSHPTIVIGVFAHNEERNISGTLRAMSRQTLLSPTDNGVSLLVLANGCRDGTCEAASEALRELMPAAAENGLAGVVDIPEPGKSRTWNTFVHELVPASAEYIVFTDADISFPDTSTLMDLIEFLRANSSVEVATSRPTKTIEIEKVSNPLDWLSRHVSRLTQSKAQHAIAGSLYCMRASLAKRIVLPNGMLVEDGFIRIAVSTNSFTMPPNDDRIQRVPGARHVFHPCRGVLAYLRHERRIVLGTLQNFAVWDWIREHSKGCVPSELVSRMNASEPEWTIPLLKARASRLGRRGMVLMAWEVGIGQLRRQRGARKVLMMPVAAARIVFSSVGGFMALRAVRTGGIAW